MNETENIDIFSGGGFTLGRQFIVTFLYNYGTQNRRHFSSENYLFISSDQPGHVTVRMTGEGNFSEWSQTSNLVPLSTITVSLPDRSELLDKLTVQPRGILVTSDVDISVYAMNDDANVTSSDASLVLPVSALGKEYIVPTTNKNPAFAIAAVLPNTHVTISLATDCTVIRGSTKVRPDYELSYQLNAYTISKSPGDRSTNQPKC